MEIVKGKIIDIFNKDIYSGELKIEGGKITEITRSSEEYPNYILPGFIDAHIHIESSMLVPYEFARIALLHGTIATVSDPHEIANVCGMAGIDYMIENGKNAGLQFFFGAPSCVPATSFETSGAVINSEDIKKLLARDDIWYLSEMMNYPGVLFQDPEIMAKIESARIMKKPVDGHAPGLVGENAVQYIQAGISTDHECTMLSEANWKLQHGMKILIREGSAAKNFDALESLISMFANMVMFCSDDKHPDDLMEGHINTLVKRALQNHSLYDVLQVACINPILHYNLPLGMLKLGDPADFIVVNNLQDWNVIDVFSKGNRVVDQGKCTLPEKSHAVINKFNREEIDLEDLPEIPSAYDACVIKALDGSLITEKSTRNEVHSGELLKIYVINRYKKTKIFGAWITGFGAMECALASSVAHDSHNIVVVGKNNHDIKEAVNEVIRHKGGLSLARSGEVHALSLPVAGLMHYQPAQEVAFSYQKLDKMAKTYGTTLHAPFMTLSFMALLVIPKLKMSDLGLFDAEKFEFIK